MRRLRPRRAAARRAPAWTALAIGLFVAALAVPGASADHGEDDDADDEGTDRQKGPKKDRGDDRGPSEPPDAAEPEEPAEAEEPQAPSSRGSVDDDVNDLGRGLGEADLVERRRTADPGTCPSLSVTAEGKGRIRVETDRPGGELHRAAPDEDLRRVHSFDEAGAYQDTDTYIGNTYTYVLLVDGAECARVETTAIPVFPTSATAVVATVAGIGAFLWQRRKA